MLLSIWLLWGDFALNFFESVFGRYLPIFLKDLQASNTLIGLMSGSFAGLVNVLFLPGISRWSDNLRTSHGRRIPLLYVVTPLTVVTVVVVGFAPEIGEWGFAHFAAFAPGLVTKRGVVLTLIGILVVSFHFFNMVLVNAYNWLIRDVVPLNIMSRFLAWFSIVGTLSGALFLWLLFPHLMSHRKEIFLAVGLFYLAAFSLMCWKVKEGQYPPPAAPKDRPGILKTFVVYFRECLQIPLYRNFFLVYLLVIAALTCASNFVTLFASDTLRLDMSGMGQIFAWTAAISIVFYYPLGWLCDRFSPMHVALGAIFAISTGAILAAVLVDNQTKFLVYSVAFSLPTVAWYLSQRATAMKLFPAEKFGQFSGALNVFGCGSLIIGNALIGVFMDWTNSNYRMSFVWTTVISACAIPLMLLVIRAWKQHGGPDNYQPPLPK